MLKAVQIADLEVQSLADTGSTVTLLREDIYRLLGPSPLRAAPLRLVGFSRGNVRPKGCIFLDIGIDNSVFSSNVYVIDFAHMLHPVILGTGVICQGVLTCGGTNITLSKPDVFINLINVCDDIAQVDLTTITDICSIDICSMICHQLENVNSVI